MFFIFDCNKSIVGNPKGYKTHRGAQTQCEKPGKIRTAIFTAHHLKEWPKNGIKHLYSINWVEAEKSKSLLDTIFQNPTEFLKNHMQVIHIK
jgi:hypothetical protein